ncbi:unnamed protein product [Cuscuta campestris]|uniref:Uncharacterized protein n=1 Tax=Cuscuta campestris TaxID=132261 RepID=A0A484KLP8_9ASTE|nr:unnamed protein product [Cuscuta campestris]
MPHVSVPDVQQTGDAPDDGHENTHEHDRIEEVQPEIVPQPDDEAVEIESGEFSNQGGAKQPTGGRANIKKNRERKGAGAEFTDQPHKPATGFLLLA